MRKHVHTHTCTAHTHAHMHTHSHTLPHMHAQHTLARTCTHNSRTHVCMPAHVQEKQDQLARQMTSNSEKGDNPMRRQVSAWALMWGWPGMQETLATAAPIRNSGQWHQLECGGQSVFVCKLINEYATGVCSSPQPPPTHPPPLCLAMHLQDSALSTTSTVMDPFMLNRGPRVKPAIMQVRVLAALAAGSTGSTGKASLPF